MELAIYLSMNGDIKIADAADDDSPLAMLVLSNEARQLDGEQRMVLGRTLRQALLTELKISGVIR